MPNAFVLFLRLFGCQFYPPIPLSCRGELHNLERIELIQVLLSWAYEVPTELYGLCSVGGKTRVLKPAELKGAKVENFGGSGNKGYGKFKFETEMDAGVDGALRITVGRIRTVGCVNRACGVTL